MMNMTTLHGVSRIYLKKKIWLAPARASSSSLTLEPEAFPPPRENYDRFTVVQKGLMFLLCPPLTLVWKRACCASLRVEKRASAEQTNEVKVIETLLLEITVAVVLSPNRD